jgi:hypothetical protein
MDDSKDMVEFLQTQLQMLLMAAGDEVPQSMVDMLVKDGEDKDAIHKFRYEYKEFYDDIMDGGQDGFEKHYEIKTIEKEKIKDEYNGLVSALGIRPKDKLSCAIMMGLQTLSDKLNGSLFENGVSLKSESQSEALKKTDKYEGLDLNSAEVRRNIEFDIGE